MPDTWQLLTSVCTTRGCQLVYRSADGLIGLHITSSSGRTDRRRYFVWGLPDSAPVYATQAEARAASTVPVLAAGRTRRRA